MKYEYVVAYHILAHYLYCCSLKLFAYLLLFIQLQDIINKSLSKKLTAPFDVHTHMRTDQITSGLVHAISTVSIQISVACKRSVFGLLAP